MVKAVPNCVIVEFIQKPCDPFQTESQGFVRKSDFLHTFFAPMKCPARPGPIFNRGQALRGFARRPSPVRTWRIR
jgi:hypothetical protein